jgi:hypothetical protein
MLPGVGERGGGDFLPDVFPDARQYVEAAFGADLTADPDTWSWTNITGPDLVQWDPGVECKIGYPNEAIEIIPASFSCDIRNDQPNGGDFTLGNPLGAHWPNIRENTPIRARLDIGNGPTVRFFGYATSWKPKWDANRQLALVTLKANGVSRRIRQGEGAARSAIRRFFEYGSTQPVRYWSLEDNSGSTSAASAITGPPPMTASGGSASGAGVRFGVAQGRTQAAYTGFEINRVGVKSFVSLAEGGTLTADLPSSTATKYAVQFIGFTWAYTGIAGSDRVMARWLTPGGSFVRYDVRVLSLDGTVELVGFDSVGAETVLVQSDISFVDEFEYVFRIENAGGGNVYTSLEIYRVASSINGLIGSFAEDTRAGTFALPTRIFLNPNGTTVNQTAITGSENQTNDMRFGHLAVWHRTPRYLTDTFTNATGVFYSAWNGFIGELPTDRITRLGNEQDVPVEIVGSSDIAMGFQDTNGFTDLLTQCSAVDQGLLIDGISAGYTYFARTQMYSRPADLTLQLNDVIGPDDPNHDDQGRINDYTASDTFGSSGRFVQASGDLGTATVGIYDDSGDHRAFYASDLYQIAAWKVAQGTVPGLRWPQLAFQLAKPSTAVAAQRWLDMPAFGHLRALDLGIGQADPDADLVLRGWSEKWNSKTWQVTANTTPYDAFGVTTLADDAGDTDEFVGWLDTDGSTVVTGIDAGATSVSVATPSGPVWTNATTPSPTYADDIVGLYINLDGMRVAVTAISGATSPQTFTVTGTDVLRAVPPGASVSVWDPVVIGL